jgi:hypothetical protein
VTAAEAFDEQLAGLRCAASADRLDGAQMAGQKL